MSESFDALSASTGIALPATLRHLIDSGAASYDDPERTAMAALYDVEWLSAGQAQQVIDRWLNPARQNGNLFLPFARSGAGDAYCVVRLRSGEEGVCMVWHDRPVSHLRYASFDRFVAAEYVTVFADLALIDDDDGDPVAFLRADVARVAGSLDPSLLAVLDDCLDKPAAEHPYRQGTKGRVEMVTALIGQDEEAALQARLGIADPLAFDVRARWES
ncbi:SMI1/KNR4 family protein [Massilia sp. CCM 8733]|uniref:SMI1/KNR4 family protein n=1 Tax=Massilia mucilaginosa TaxID=2609282 RepID=A0ABX0P2C3_9BURK|nr:SMI1/KNR4 family protein [Massilia mucilaginosa]NHZ93109.1 SMI1/KNR4 family protein [Massilia mucilaginosa]